MSPKILVTHTNPDLDAVCACWLVKRFFAGWEEAELQFVPAGETYQQLAGKNEQVLVVDTGMGEFDHHQADSDTCAADLVFQYLQRVAKEKRPRFMAKKFLAAALERLVKVVNDYDHFRQVYFPEAAADYQDFSLVTLLDGLNLVYNKGGSGDIQVVDFGFQALDAVYQTLQNKVRAEEEIEKLGQVTEVKKWGKIAGFLSSNDEVLDLAQKLGFSVVVRKDPKKHYLRIKTLPGKNLDLTPIYKILQQKDPAATWFLHASHNMLLNGSTRNPKMKPTKLTLEEVLQVFKTTV